MAKIYDNPATVAEEKATEETATPDVIEKLTEMCNSMAASIENISKVISQQDGLVEIIEASDRAPERAVRHACIPHGLFERSTRKGRQACGKRAYTCVLHRYRA